MDQGERKTEESRVLVLLIRKTELSSNEMGKTI